MNKDDEKTLPPGWVLCQSKNSGRTYYFNRKTGKSLWTQPEAEEKSRCPVQNTAEKPRKEEPEKKNLKRKSDSYPEDTSSPKKRLDREIPTATPTPTPQKPKESTPTSVKNSANKRLQQLRKQLSDEVRDEKTTERNQIKSPVKHKPDERRPSPKVNPDTPTKSKPVDIKSPVTDSRCPTTQSPSSDSYHSIPSPSQFFAANKILSSMKAQLPDEYCNKMKPKDTFADIDQAICSQILEYPSTKHPSTPPQFSEASKICSAIKSKLAYRSLADNLNSTEVKVYNTASDRMKALRMSLSKETEEMSELNNSCVNNETKTALKRSRPEAMEIEVSMEKKPRITPPCTSSTTNNITETTKENLVIVIDTNIFIHELDVIKNVVNSHIKGYSQQPTLLVPWRVINELDRLKDNNNGNGAICKRARAAMDYLYQSLPENTRIKGQSLRDANSHIYPCEIPDDEILNCCLQQAERGKSVILISNDKNLCSKAIINAVKSITLAELKTMLMNKPQESSDPDLQATMKRYENTIYQLLANILENEMRAKYNTLWQRVLFKAPPWTLRDVLQCLLKHWVAVFSEVFPRIEHLIKELQHALVAAQDKGDSLTQSEVSTFKELSLEVARKCRIIPEYMELAKRTVERLGRAESPEPRHSDEMPVIEAFEAVWTVLSSYCAKLSSGLGITHSIEDKLIGDEPLTALTGKFRVFSEQIHNFTDTIKGVLNVSSDSDPALNSLTRCLETVFKDCLHLISADSSAVSRDSLRLFCTKCRNMLQEAYTKFAHLTELLDMCENAMND